MIVSAEALENAKIEKGGTVKVTVSGSKAPNPLRLSTFSGPPSEYGEPIPFMSTDLSDYSIDECLFIAVFAVLMTLSLL